jgi:hypothetical protein
MEAMEHPGTGFRRAGLIGFAALLLSTGLSAQRLQPSDFAYLGAFRLPEVSTAPPAVWDWAGQAMTYYPGGDPSGGGDGFPGSLFATGLDTENWVCEFSIPAPSLSRDIGALPVATVIQPFADVSGCLFSAHNEQPRVGVEYLPAGPGRPAGRLYLAWGQHFQFDPGVNILPTHAWCGLALAGPGTRGPWRVGTQAENYAGFSYRTNDYLFAIPDAWAGAHTGGRTPPSRTALRIRASPGPAAATGRGEGRIGPRTRPHRFNYLLG